LAEYKIVPGGLHDRALRSRKKIQIIGGGFGNGKTACGCVKAVILAKEYPGSNGIVAMATYAQLNDTIRTEMYKWMPPSAIRKMPTVTDNTMYLKNGSKINFRYLQQKGKTSADGQTSSNLLSATYDWAVVDQIENPAITYKDFLDLLGRLRGNTPYKGNDPTMPSSGPRWLILLANPSFNWVYHKLIKPMHLYQKHGHVSADLIVDPETNEPMMDLFEGSTYENQHNLEPDFIKGLESAYKGQFRERYLGGSWAAFEGLVYPNFSHDQHVVAQEDILSYMYSCRAKGLQLQSIEGLDWGLASPTCYLFGFTDPFGRVFILDGFYKSEMGLKDIGEGIASIHRKYYPFVNIDMPVLADPAIFKRTVRLGSGKGADTIARVLMEHFPGLMLKPAQNDVLSGIAKVSAYLSITEFPHFLTNHCNGGLIYFAKHLFFLPDEFGAYFWKMSKHGTDRIDEPIDANDHAMDTLKYMVSYLPDAADMLFKVNQYRYLEATG
jgi:hypothetical protein